MRWLIIALAFLVCSVSSRSAKAELIPSDLDTLETWLVNIYLLNGSIYGAIYNLPDKLDDLQDGMSSMETAIVGASADVSAMASSVEQSAFLLLVIAVVGCFIWAALTWRLIQLSIHKKGFI